MAIQAHVYPDNLSLPLGGGGVVSQDCFIMDIHPLNHNNMFNGCADLTFANKPLLQHQFHQHQQQQQYLLQQLQQNQNYQQINHSDAGFVFRASSKPDMNNAAATSTSTTTTTNSDHMGYSHTLATQLDKQRHSIDKYISVQNERLKLALHQQRKQQLATLMRKLETKAAILLKQKDEAIAKATTKNRELEEHIRKMESENQVWQRVAAENEAMVVSLNNALEQVKEQACYLSSSNGIEDAESCCDDNDYHPFCEKGEATSTAGGETSKKRKMMMMMCRVCNSRKSCVLMLPCRHLCSCKHCDAFLDACPVCKSLKKASIEAFFS